MREKGNKETATPLQSMIGVDAESMHFFEEHSIEAQNKKQLLAQSKVEVNDFDILKVIGRGTFGKVYLVKKRGRGDPDDGQVYAMKVLKKSQILKRNLKVKTFGKSLV